MKTETSSKTFSVDELRQQISGQVITSEDTEYDDSRKVFISSIDKHPKAVVKVADAKDVAKTILFAREQSADIAVRSGGHSGVGFSLAEGGVVIDLGNLRGLDIDAKAGIAWAETGLTAGEYTEATGKQGMSTGFGDTATVGIGGLTTGGGVGYLIRKYGLTIDSLLAADVVTADGEILHIDEEHYPDLFWAIRGGGGNFGVATRFKFQLQPVSDIVGGLLLLPATPETISGFMTAAEEAPDELSGIANVMPAPPMPFLPPEMHGKTIIFGMLVYAGSGEAGKRAIAPFKKLATPLGDMTGPKKYPEIYQEPEGPHPFASSVRSMFMDKVHKADAQFMLDQLEKNNAQIRAVQLRVLGGAAARVPVMATAYAHRKSKIMVNIATVYDSLADAPRHDAWVKETGKGLEQSDKGAYVNFLLNEGEARTRAAYPGFTWQRLTEIKKKYDPDNLFHLNQNIPPAK
jgi:FAD/FMN-containing dehydrogenase